jgi:hypothetical protein
MRNTTNINKASSGKITGHSKVNKANLLERIESLRDGNLVDDVFNSLETFKLSEVSFDDLYKALGQEDAAYLWNLLVQHNVYLETEEYPLLADVREFSYYEQDEAGLTANEGADQYIQAQEYKANKIKNEQQAILWLKNQIKDTATEEPKNQKVIVKFLPATNTKGARYSVNGLGGRKILDFNYAARYKEQAAALEYLEATTSRKDWNLVELEDNKNTTTFLAYSLTPVNITKHQPIVQDYSWTA